jgi:hypothetical protein
VHPPKTASVTQRESRVLGQGGCLTPQSEHNDLKCEGEEESNRMDRLYIRVRADDEAGWADRGEMTGGLGDPDISCLLEPRCEAHVQASSHTPY